MKNEIGRGAEAVLIKKGKSLIKERIKKGYRIPEIDLKIRKQCTRDEYKLLEKAYSLIPVPKIISIDESKFKIEMEFIEGKRISDFLDSFDNKKREEICNFIGKQVAILHNKNIIHGDLTTSNMILKGDDIYFIDFGLGFISEKIEDKAVDIHLLRQALESKHYLHYEDSFNFVLQGYESISETPKSIFERLEIVEKRGRYKIRL